MCTINGLPNKRLTVHKRKMFAESGAQARFPSYITECAKRDRSDWDKSARQKGQERLAHSSVRRQERDGYSRVRVPYGKMVREGIVKRVCERFDCEVELPKKAYKWVTELL